ncbi:MAG: hypothetical protein U1C57_01985 [Candidatus Doudnabacteria bacterium]|nr:hypothetical protein [Candidatus Doudnabacteria bacterium]
MSSVKNKFVGGDINKQMYRSKESYQDQMRTATEKDRAEIVTRPESEFVRPYASESYEEMEYNFIPPPGFGPPGGFPPETWDLPDFPDIETPEFPSPNYPSPQVPPPNYPPQFLPPQFQPPQFQPPNYPPQFLPPNYPSPQVPDPQFPSVDFPTPVFPAPKYSDPVFQPPQYTYPELSPYQPWSITFYCSLDPCWCPGETRTFSANCTYPVVKLLNVDQFLGNGTISAVASGGAIRITAAAEVDDWDAISFYILMRAKTPEGKYVYGTYGKVRASKCRPNSECDECIACTVETPIISYITQCMQIDETQDLEVINYGEIPAACFTWGLSGGGSLSATTGYTTTYTAPHENAECTDNPTITLYCDGTGADALDLSVNESPNTGAAFIVRAVTNCYAGCCCGGGTGWVKVSGTGTIYLCDGSIECVCTITDALECGGTPTCPSWGTLCGNLANCSVQYDGCSSIYFGSPCEPKTDVRTAEMITQGCCPEKCM